MGRSGGPATQQVFSPAPALGRPGSLSCPSVAWQAACRQPSSSEQKRRLGCQRPQVWRPRLQARAGDSSNYHEAVQGWGWGGAGDHSTGREAGLPGRTPAPTASPRARPRPWVPELSPRPPLLPALTLSGQGPHGGEAGTCTGPSAPRHLLTSRGLDPGSVRPPTLRGDVARGGNDRAPWWTAVLVPDRREASVGDGAWGHRVKWGVREAGSEVAGSRVSCVRFGWTLGTFLRVFLVPRTR